MGGSIINGFALPLKDEHKDFLTKALIPLHKVKSLASFYQQLSYCMAQYVEKDPRLSYDIITSMLRYWPVSITAKQVLFLMIRLFGPSFRADKLALQVDS